MSVLQRMREHYTEVRIRDEKWLMRLDMQRLRTAMLALFGLFVALNLTDIATTAFALHSGPPFVELNPIANLLFRYQYSGFAAALALKFAPLVPLSYGVFKESGKDQVQLRTVKLGVFVSLGAADLLYIAIVASNLLTLLAGISVL